jgi:DNA-binding transcriptional regulator GbsR (MarR family)
MIVALYYDRELTLKEIGAVLEVSESRVSQMLSAVARKLRETMGASEADTRAARQHPKGIGGSDPRVISRGRTTCS